MESISKINFFKDKYTLSEKRAENKLKKMNGLYLSNAPGMHRPNMGGNIMPSIIEKPPPTASEEATKNECDSFYNCKY